MDPIEFFRENPDYIVLVLIIAVGAIGYALITWRYAMQLKRDGSALMEELLKWKGRAERAEAKIEQAKDDGDWWKHQ